MPNRLPLPVEIDPIDALTRQRDGTVLIDVREDGEREAGMPAGAHGIARAQLPERIDALANRTTPVLLICASGRRSLLARDDLLALGYRDVASVRGGFTRWRAEGLPQADGAFDSDSAERYARHLLLPEVGVAGQRRLAQARIAMVGAGGLGSPASLYLVAAGIGHISLIDDDHVERSNLQRQIVHADARVGMAKVESARQTLAALNPQVHIDTHETRLSAANVEALIAGHEVVIDGADNFPTRYLLDAACRRLRIPLVYGAVHRFSGQVSVFDARRDDSPCYRCLFPEAPSAAEAPNCSEAGVLGVLPGTIGLLQATEAIKLILGQGRTLVGRLLCYDALAAGFHELALPRDPACPGCGPDAVFDGYVDLAARCRAEP
ncbi:MAG: molybdopterin-synthase adenylyltransferase MoeB [Luteimonas sp.]|uniref:molybdopterin-synthase adenylyltransferase MoeB n=1 Tax=Dokdonella sp. TaxID=2291710 RepID=UPI0025C11B20|nr:molybdopterin-synthase adenylyltransferase MoeB [Dokdonella sp.]MBX3693374.1 molybdopterin-synthase adenylyltransferase MoeB [Dokdonella sp.]MCW5580514.1 molybdopterin-synthase adenylyltransferase MoeB [Luteimonas sp.]HNR92228.1 molybdopterin-synthase adenylyltransferase MoeB [Dokdonella sp.]